MRMIKVLQGFSNKLFVVGICLLMVGMTFSTWLTSASQFIMAIAWIIKFDWKNQLIGFVKNPMSKWLSMLFIIYLFSQLYSENQSQGWSEIRILIPLFAIPLLFSGGFVITKKQFHNLMFFYLLVVIAASFSCIPGILKYYNGDLANVRMASLFVSHIRLSLHVSLAMFIAAYYLIRSYKYWYLAIYIIILFAWLLAMQSLTGIIIVFILAFASLVFYSLIKFKLIYSAICVLIGFLIGFSVIKLFQYEYNQFMTPVESSIQTDLKTPDGNDYEFDFSMPLIENGHYVYYYINSEELAKVWSEKSSFDFDGFDRFGQPLKQTIIRYLNSKGLKKDGQSLASLTQNEIRIIENGIANAAYHKSFGIKARLYQFFWELEVQKFTDNSPSQGLMLKPFLWEAAFEIWKKNMWFGTGVGDLKQGFENYYESKKPQINNELKLRAHNQFITIAITSGLIGLFLYLFSIIKIISLNNNLKFTPIVYFFLIALLSMFTEDTLNTQAGATFYAFFISFFSFFPSLPATTNTISPLGDLTLK